MRATLRRPWWILAALLALVLPGTATRGDDWPQWLGPRRDDIWREAGIMARFPPGGPPIRWRVPIHGGYAGPAVAEGRVYVLDRVLPAGTHRPKDPFQSGTFPGQERVVCLNEADGKVLWTHPYDCSYTIQFPYGPRCTPAVGGGKVYTLGAEGNLLCLDAARGDLLWAHDFKKDYGATPPTWGYAAHPLLDGQKLICMVGGKGSTVVAFDKDSGKEIWHALSATEPGYCPPMIYELGGRRQLIIWDADAVAGLDPETGKVYWSQPVKVYQGMAISTPRQHGQSLFVTGAGDIAILLHFQPDHPTAEVVWQRNPLKKKKGFSTVFTTPFFDEGYIYGTNGLTGALVCIKAGTGEPVWETMQPNGGKHRQSGDIFLIKNGSRFFLVTDQGDLLIARLSPKGYQEISRAHLIEPTSTAWGHAVVWSHPAFAHRSMFARNDKEILCVSLAASQAER